MITHVAVRRNGVVYSLPAPNRHHNVLYECIPKEARDEESEEREVQGFLDDSGKFLTRSEAYDLVVNTPQFIRHEKNRGRENYYDGPLLFSEDLW